MRKWRRLALAVVTTVGASAAQAEEAGRTWTPFVIPAQMSAESRIAFRGDPIGVDSPRVVVKDGHFFVGDRRLRIWGVNLSYGANFPSHSDAERVAARLEAFGINSVRFHHMDMEYFRFPQSIWDPAEPTKLSEEALDRLDYFIDQLARRGIYANINLHVSRTHSRHLGLPDTKATGNYDKIVDLFTPELIAAQKDYARQLLTRVNKYRNIAYGKDPAVAFVEINNEDSFFMWDAEAKMRAMAPHYARILQEQYNAWLKDRYGTTTALAAAWASPEDAKAAAAVAMPLSGENARWKVSGFQGAAATMTPTGDGARIEIGSVGSAAWHLELLYSGLAIDRDRQYELVFRARSDAPRDVVATVRQGHPPYGTRGLRQTVKLTPQWQTFALPFQPPESEADARASILFGQSAAAFEISDVQVRTLPLVGLAEGERLEDASVAFFIDGASRHRVRDRMRFLASTEKAYFDGFRDFIREDLDCDALVTGTIAFGFLGLWAQSGMDYIDAHTYWAHPQFPSGWSETNWTIDQKSFVQQPETSKLFDDVATRLAGKPFTVSEYSHPAPNDYQAEGVPLIATFAAAQDWDGVWLFGYADKHDDWGATSFDGFFNIHANPAKWGFVPLGAAIFREGGIEPLPFGHVWPLTGDADPLNDLVTLHLTHHHSMLNGLNDRWGIGRPAALRQRVAITFEGDPAALPAHPQSVTSLDLEAGRLRATGRSAIVRIETAGGSDAVAADRGFAVLAGASLDGRPRAESEDALLALIGRCENQNMGFSGDRRTVRNQWGTGPVQIEALAATLRLPIPRELRLVPLNPDGSPKPADVVPSQDEDHALFGVSPEHRTMWYVLSPG